MKTDDRLRPPQTMLVTGGAGFIGSHLVERLLEDGHHVRVLDDFSQGTEANLEQAGRHRNFRLITGTITDFEVVMLAMLGVDYVFHMAAMSRVEPSIKRPHECAAVNVTGTLNVLRAAWENGVRKVVYSGSSTYYGSQTPPQAERLLPDILNPYGATKYMGEVWCETFAKTYDQPTLTLRYFNVYGPRQPTEGAYALVLGLFIRAAKEGKPLTIHGDGSQRRDFVHVTDVVEANLAAARCVSSGMAINIGSGVNYSIKQVADMISDNQVYGPARHGDAAATLAAIDRAQRLLLWRPKVAFEDGLRELMRVHDPRKTTLPPDSWL